MFQPRGAGPGIVVGARETYLDVQGYMEVVSDWAEAFSEAQFLFEGAIEIDRHRSAALVRIVGVGSGSGIQVARTALDVHELRRGTVVRQTFWWDRDAGLRSLGLTPPARSK